MRNILIFCLAVGRCLVGVAAGQMALPDCAGGANYLANTHSEIWETSNANVRVLPFSNRRLETSVVTDEKIREKVDVVLVADVADVSFDSLGNLNHTCVTGVKNGYSPAVPVATYRVELLVRTVEEGAFDYDRLAFVVDPRKHNTLCDYFSGWPFFRGVTVKAVLCRVDGKLCVSRIRLALPYPPYDANNIWAGYDGNLPSRSRFSLNPKALARPKDAVAVLYIPYGNHTLAKFYSTTNDTTGSFGRFPDYSRSVRVEVWTASEGADADYWKTAWFSERREQVPVVTVRNVEEGMDAETRLAFAWHDFMLNPRMLSSVKTLGAFVELVNRDTVCKVCKKPHYRIVLPDILRSRAVRFEKNACGFVLDLLKSVCEMTGCTYGLKGTNLVLGSELSEDELADKSLKGRLHVLEKDGFASVKDADYVGFVFWNNGSGLAKPHDIPHVFSYQSAYVMTGNGWRRKTADGKFRYLMFDSGWWEMDEGCLASFSLEEAKPRLARDVAKVRAYLRGAAESPDEFEFPYDAVKKDSFALAFALHLCQLGRTEDAQSVYDALCLRPAAAEAAFAKLRQRVKVGKRQYPTLDAWQKSAAAGKEK